MTLARSLAPRMASQVSSFGRARRLATVSPAVTLMAMLVAMLVVSAIGFWTPTSSMPLAPADAAGRPDHSAISSLVGVVDRGPSGTGGLPLGSGSVVDFDGHVLTDRHAIGGASHLGVVLSDGHAYPADVVGTDPAHDLALLKAKIPPEALHPLSLSGSSALQVGRRDVPSSVVRSRLPEMVWGDLRAKPWLGITVRDDEPDTSGHTSLSGFDDHAPQEASEAEIEGALLDRVLPGSPADDAQLQGSAYLFRLGNGTLTQAGDVVIAIDGARVRSADDLASYLTRAGKHVGDPVTIRIVRGDQVFDVLLWLRARDYSRADQAGAI